MCTTGCTLRSPLQVMLIPYSRVQTDIDALSLLLVLAKISGPLAPALAATRNQQTSIAYYRRV
jgi:hypothetical protein